MSGIAAPQTGNPVQHIAAIATVASMALPPERSTAKPVELTSGLFARTIASIDKAAARGGPPDSIMG